MRRVTPSSIVTVRKQLTSKFPPGKLDRVTDEETPGKVISKRPIGRGVMRTPPKGKVIGYGSED